jgi:hypothetical protein
MLYSIIWDGYMKMNGENESMEGGSHGLFQGIIPKSAYRFWGISWKNTAEIQTFQYKYKPLGLHYHAWFEHGCP